MPTEKFANQAQDYLASGINNSVTSLTLVSASEFPTSGNFRIRVDSEFMLVTAVSGNTFTVTRGVESSTAVSHSAGAIVSLIMTAGSLNQFFTDNITLDVATNRPASERGGKIYKDSDSPFAYMDTGTAWYGLGPTWVLTPPNSGSFTWFRQQTATIDTSRGGISMYDPGNGSSATTNVVGLKTAIASTPYTLTAGFLVNVYPTSYNQVMIGLYDNSSTKLHTLGFQFSSGTFNYLGAKYNSPTSFNNGYFSIDGRGFQSSVLWLRISNDGVNKKCWCSNDGYNWLLIDTQGATDFLTPTHFMWGMEPAPGPISAWLISWAVT